MDITTINLSKCLHDQFKHKHASFEEVSKEYFLQLQNDNIRRPSLIFRTEDIELPEGNSKVTVYSLVYVNGKSTKYFVSRSVFVVPPSYFLGDKEDALIIQWLKSDKAVFLRQQRLTAKEEPLPKPFHMVLTPSETREVYECTRIVQQLDDGMYSLMTTLTLTTKSPHIFQNKRWRNAQISFNHLTSRKNKVYIRSLTEIFNCLILALNLTF